MDSQPVEVLADVADKVVPPGLAETSRYACDLRDADALEAGQEEKDVEMALCAKTAQL